jgi:hypothetical protein
MRAQRGSSGTQKGAFGMSERSRGLAFAVRVVILTAIWLAVLGVVIARGVIH